MAPHERPKALEELTDAQRQTLIVLWVRSGGIYFEGNGIWYTTVQKLCVYGHDVVTLHRKGFVRPGLRNHRKMFVLTDKANVLLSVYMKRSWKEFLDLMPNDI